MIWNLLAAVGAVVLLFALVSPLESLRWWARRSDRDTIAALTRSDLQSTGTADARRFVVYLSGIGSVDGSTDSRRERATLADLHERVPDVVITADVFPYAVGSGGLARKAKFWDWLRRLRKVPVAGLIAYLIQLRNALRVLVSADPRYGPTYNLAVAQEITNSLTRHGYPWQTRPPVTIIGYSGGGQIALGAAWYVAALDVPVSVISIGGVLAADPALDRVEHVWHLTGTKDRMHYLGDLVFPGRWALAKLSPWHRAKRAGKITETTVGPMRHMSGKDYFDRHVTDPATGQTYREETTAALAAILAD